MRSPRRTSPHGGLSSSIQVSGSLDCSEVPVVLVHGMGGDRTTWRPLASRLRREGRTVVSFDMRGHGRTGPADSYRLDDFRDDLARVVDEVGVERVDLVGHSLGAHTALRFAISAPERARRIVLEEVPPMPRDESDLADEVTPTTTLGERIRGLGAVVANPAPFLRFDRALGEPVLSAFTVAEPAWWCSLQKVTAPTLVVSGGRRSFLPPEHLRDLAYALPSGDFMTIDAGHSVHRDRCDEFAGAVLAHLA
ncbi:alpha/beta hydrolase [Gordonia sp. HY002]|uniref:alpha/beta fold hydrolase n=1 Tax=Gordonia zhenghanii TaxID=2911516 RepID=UPI001EF01540|nr:alpha/beta hydrolase [Gordonia zhenghanii]MCF8570225.1 alpha/beta hydrolase [Gordonia zhenghanii]MCF8607074.1 alpha/beta hydrolase [Gordonia zhenghanii]